MALVGRTGNESRKRDNRVATITRAIQRRIISMEEYLFGLVMFAIGLCFGVVIGSIK